MAAGAAAEGEHAVPGSDATPRKAPATLRTVPTADPTTF